MKLTPETWHKRYQEQARWTKPARNYLFGKAGSVEGKRILDVGCGTGSVLREFDPENQSTLFGLDISMENLRIAQHIVPGAELQQADAHRLPFSSRCFDLVYTHYVILWLNNPPDAIKEFIRVTKPGGCVLALAEPDYGGRIDNPPELSVIGDWQIDSLKHQGADPFAGRKIGQLFLTAGLTDVYSGVLGGEWHHSHTNKTDSSEWEIIENDLRSLPGMPPPWEINRLQQLDVQAQKAGTRLLYVPTFYAIGRVPE